MKKKIIVLLVLFAAISVPVVVKMYNSYQIYLSGEEEFLAKAIDKKEKLESGELELTNDQLAEMYVSAAKAEPSRYGMRRALILNISLFLGGMAMFVLGWYFGYREGRKSNG